MYLHGIQLAKYKADRTKGDIRNNMARRTKLYIIQEPDKSYAWMTVPVSLRPFMAKHYGSFHLSPIPDRLLHELKSRGLSLNGSTTAAKINPMLREDVIQNIQSKANLYTRVFLSRHTNYGTFRVYIYHLTGKLDTAKSSTSQWTSAPPPQPSKLPETFEGMAQYLHDLEGKLVATERLLLAKAAELNIQISFNNALRNENNRLQSELSRARSGGFRGSLFGSNGNNPYEKFLKYLDPEGLKRVWYVVSRELHPDHNPGIDRAKFQEASNAYSEINPKK
jgi:hypothetical protein